MWLLGTLAFSERILELPQRSGIFGIFKGDAIKICPVPLPTPSSTGSYGIAFDMRCCVFRGELQAAGGASGRCVRTKATATHALSDESLPLTIDDLVRRRRRRHPYKKAVGVTEGGEHAATVAVGVREIAERRVQEGIAVGSRTVLAIALVQRKHRNIIVRFRAVYEGRAGREARRRGS